MQKLVLYFTLISLLTTCFNINTTHLSTQKKQDIIAEIKLLEKNGDFMFHTQNICIHAPLATLITYVLATGNQTTKTKMLTKLSGLTTIILTVGLFYTQYQLNLIHQKINLLKASLEKAKDC